MQDAFSYDLPDRMESVRQWREALTRQLLTPAPDAGAVTWNRRALADEQHVFVGIKRERIKQAIADDVAWLAAHPMRRSKRKIGS